MEKLVLIDGNSIMNRAFYGIMGSKMLTTSDGKYTNAIYGFLAILFKLIEDIKPEYMVVAFDLKAPTARHKAYDGYKANRHGMPDELAEQMPMIKEILRAMNIEIVEKEGYEADDILGTLSKYGESKGLEVTILSGDRDTFQLATDNVKIRIPRTKGGKTETDTFDRNKVIETYGVEPKQLIEVKGLQGDTSDNIPGVPGIGEKTALSLIQKYETIENLYKQIELETDDLKGKQREKIVQNRELAELSRFLGTINLEVPIEENLENFKVEEWNRKKVLELFKKLRFNKYIERFSLKDDETIIENYNKTKSLEIEEKSVEEIIDIIKCQGKMIFYIGTEKLEDEELIIKEKITSLSIYNEITQKAYFIEIDVDKLESLKIVFEDAQIKKQGIDLNKAYILLKQEGITIKGLDYDIAVAAYILNSTNNKLTLTSLAQEYLEMDLHELLGDEKKDIQINLFEQENNEEKKNREKYTRYVEVISKIKNITLEKLKEINAEELFYNIDMPTVEVLANMQWNGMYIEKQELLDFGIELKQNLEELSKQIYELAGEEFNINSTKQLGVILFEKMKLPIIKKNKSGYSTDVDVLEKLKGEDPIIEKILEYRQLMKLNSTYVEGLVPYINPKTNRIHSFFHQTITATGRISSTEPNLQNIPTRFELGKRIRKVFKPEVGSIYLDADYSQIELRVLAHIAEDEQMIEAFQNNEDIHRQAASKVFKVPLNEVTKKQRSDAKAVNFGIVYGISDFGLGEQLSISRKLAKQYIDEYLEQYNSIDKYMKNITEEAKENGYVETLYHRRRYIPELKSNNYMVRQFGARAAMNTPIQGTAADIMKLAMINVYKKLQENGLKSKIILQVHDEMIIETKMEEVEKVRKIMVDEMQNVIKLKVPLIAEISEAKNWYDCK